MGMDELQIMPDLDGAALAALRASIKRHGVLVPVVMDQHDRVIDGHHRQRIAEELGIEYHVDVIRVADDDDAVELAGTLNLARRHLNADQRRALASDLRVAGHSLRAIGRALGVDDKTVRNDLATADMSAVPERVTGLDGKSRPAKRPAGSVQPGDAVTDDSGDERVVTDVEHVGDEIVLHDGQGDAAIVGADAEVAVRPITKPDLGGGISHPARFSLALLPIFAEALPPDQYKVVLDPFAGTGRIHELENTTVGVEIEPEWAELHPDTQVGSALDLPFADGDFDAVCTSPCYGNRLADAHDAADGSVRRSYTHDLGRKLNPDNAGALQWGPRYRDFHEQAWEEVWRILRPGGRFVLNVKDHIRGGERQPVAGWHVTRLIALGFMLSWCCDEPTGNLRQGENADARLPEQVFVLDKPGER
ncbi:MAG TPA: ParB N-terminal domain-containing protein [Acidimicrobiales bacterium]|nr:ParB N-terminal domain-containing protein [Acidimicrobiales bacterium]